MSDDEARAGYLRQVEAKRGADAAAALRRATWEILKGATNGK